MIIKITKELLVRFWEKVEDLSNKTGVDCWNWIGGLSDGYGSIRITLDYGFSKSFNAHWLSYLMFKGNINRELDVGHNCDNRRCINPWHLELKTRSRNMLECRDRLNPVGIKMSMEIANEIRRRYKEENITQKELSVIYGVSRPLISKIIINKYWNKI